MPDLERGVSAALSVLVMGYPCAVGIAAPLAIVRGAGAAAEQGIVMRTGEAFQAFGSVRIIVLDKTGTLTEGRPRVHELVALDRADNLLTLAAAAESQSEHPLAQAIVDEAFERRLDVPPIDDFESVTGHGVAATIGGSRILIGRPGWLADESADVTALADRIAELEELGRTVVAVARNRQVLANAATVLVKDVVEFELHGPYR